MGKGKGKGKSKDKQEKAGEAKKAKGPKLLGKHAAASDVAFSPDGSLFAIAPNMYDPPGERTIEIVDLATGKVTLVLGPVESGVGHLAFTPDGSQLLASHADSTVSIWQVAGP